MLRWASRLLAIFLLASAYPAPAWSDDFDADECADPITEYTSALLGEKSGREIWTGVDVADHTWLIFSGFTYAPSGGIFENGPRIRIMAGYGGFSFGRAGETIDVTKSSADLLAGYQQRIGALTAKVFAGLSLMSHELSAFDETATISARGVKAMIELWLNLGDAAWTSLDAAWAEPYDTSSLRSRTGYRIYPGLSLGVEAALNLDDGSICRLEDASPDSCEISHDVAGVKALIERTRGGVFARYDWVTGEVSLALGTLADEGASDESDFDPYATVQWLTQF